MSDKRTLLPFLQLTLSPLLILEILIDQPPYRDRLINDNFTRVFLSAIVDDLWRERETEAEKGWQKRLDRRMLETSKCFLKWTGLERQTRRDSCFEYRGCGMNTCYVVSRSSWLYLYRENGELLKRLPTKLKFSSLLLLLLLLNTNAYNNILRR